MPTSRKKIPLKTPRRSVMSFDIELGGTSLIQKIVFAKHLSLMLKSGLSITEALKILYQSATGHIKAVIEEIYNSVKAGRSLAQALTRHPKVFSQFFVGAVYAGEVSGTLSDSLNLVAEQLKKDKELKDKIKGALLYPVVILMATFVLSMFLAFYILPRIVPLFTGLKVKLPWSTQLLIAFAHAVEKYGLALFVVIIAAVIFLAWLLKQKFSRPVTHWFNLRLPIAKDITRHSNLARFSGNLATLLKSGLTIVEALDISAKTTTNFYYARALTQVSRGVTKGQKLSDNLAKHRMYFPAMVIRMVGVGEQSGKLEETLFYLSEFYDLEVDNATKNLSTVVEPLLLIFIGLAVGFLALSIITPIYSITGTVTR